VRGKPVFFLKRFAGEGRGLREEKGRRVANHPKNLLEEWAILAFRREVIFGPVMTFLQKSERGDPQEGHHGGAHCRRRRGRTGKGKVVTPLGEQIQNNRRLPGVHNWRRGGRGEERTFGRTLWGYT